ncbi:MAG: prealbumin-like fold domain-containing protein [Acidobacteriota bacterium]
MRGSWVKNLPGLVLVLSALIVLLPVNTAHAFNRASAGVVHSMVVAGESGRALAGVTIKVLDMESAETVAEAVTSKEGTVEFGDLPYGLYQVSVAAPEGYAGAAGPLVYLDGDNPSRSVNFSLEPLPAAPAAAAGGGFPVWATILIIAGSATAAGLIINEITENETP